MRDVLTSRYGNKALNNREYYIVAISSGLPKFRIDYEIDDRIYAFAPSRAIWNLPRSLFEERYREQILRFGREKTERLLNGIERKADGKKIVMLCFEDLRDESQYCHRTILGEVLTEMFGIDVREMDDPSEVKTKKVEKPKKKEYNKKEVEQLCLFELI